MTRAARVVVVVIVVLFLVVIFTGVRAWAPGAWAYLFGGPTPTEVSALDTARANLLQTANKLGDVARQSVRIAEQQAQIEELNRRLDATEADLALERKLRLAADAQVARLRRTTTARAATTTRRVNNENANFAIRKR
jgi:hypothetical protein